MEVPVAHLKSSLIPEYPLQFSAYEKRCQHEAAQLRQKRSLLSSAQDFPCQAPTRDSSAFQAKCEAEMRRKLLILSEVQRVRDFEVSGADLNPPTFYKAQILREQRMRQSRGLKGQTLLSSYSLALYERQNTFQDAFYSRLAQPLIGTQSLQAVVQSSVLDPTARELQTLNCKRMHDYQKRFDFDREQLEAGASRQACDLDADIDQNHIARRNQLAARATSRARRVRVLDQQEFSFQPQITDVARDLTEGRLPLMQRYDQEIRELREAQRIARQRQAELEMKESQINLQPTSTAQKRHKDILQFHQRQRDMQARMLAHDEQRKQNQRYREIREEEELQALRDAQSSKMATTSRNKPAEWSRPDEGAFQSAELKAHVARLRSASVERERVRRMTDLRSNK